MQEVASARGFNRTKYAAVVSNQRFTKSAQALAASLDVYLLHHADLTQINDILGHAQSQLAAS